VKWFLERPAAPMPASLAGVTIGAGRIAADRARCAVWGGRIAEFHVSRVACVALLQQIADY